MKRSPMNLFFAAAAAVALCPLLAGCGSGGSTAGSPNAGGASFAWARTAGYSGNTVGTGVATFADGSSVTVGVFDGQAVFGAGTPTAKTLVPGTAPGAFLARYDASGHFEWVKSVVGAGTVQAMGVVTHADGTFTVTGFFDGTATFGAGEPLQTTLVTSGFEDVFVAHFLGNGHLMWVKTAVDAGGYDESTRIAARPDGTVAITGLYTAPITFGSGELNETTLASSGSGVDGFVASFALNGSLAWAVSFQGSGGASGWGIAALSDGGVAVCGDYAGEAIFALGDLNETHLTAVGSTLDAFVARFGADGSLGWARTMGDIGDDTAYGVAVVPGDGVRVVGVFGGDAVFGSEGPSPITVPGFGDVTDDFVAGYDASGTLEWAKGFGGTGYDYAGAIATFSDGTFVVTGAVAGDATFGSGELGETHLSTLGLGDHEAFVARFQPDGVLDWAAITNGVATSDNEGTSIATNLDDTCVATGYFTDSLTFGGGDTIFGHNGSTFGGGGDHDAYVARYNPNGQ